jgi:hypothetical protein
MTTREGRDVEDRGKTSLERRYRQWLRVYPRTYRGEREEEILQTLLALSRPGQRWPAPREVAAMTLQGLRVRANAVDAFAAPRQWLAALPLAACLLLALRLMDVFLVLPNALGDATTRAPENLARLAWPALPAGLVLAAVHWRAYRLAILFAAAPALVDVLLIPHGNFAGAPGSPVGLVALDVAAQLLPAALLLPLVLSSGGPPAPRRWQVGVPMVLVAPMVGLDSMQRGPVDTTADNGMLWIVMAVLVFLTLLGILLWGALVDGCVALAVSLCLLASAALALGSANATAGPAPSGLIAVTSGAGLVLACAGTYRTHQQTVGRLTPRRR